MPEPNKLLDDVHLALRRGGILITTDPYYWDTARASIEQWLGGRLGEPSSDAMRNAISKRFSLLAEQDMVPWVLKEYDRYFKLYFNHHLVARKDS